MKKIILTLILLLPSTGFSEEKEDFLTEAIDELVVVDEALKEKAEDSESVVLKIKNKIIDLGDSIITASNRKKQDAPYRTISKQSDNQLKIKKQKKEPEPKKDKEGL